MAEDETMGWDGAMLFSITTLFGSLSWLLTKALIVALEENTEQNSSGNATGDFRIAVFCMWATCLGSGLSAAVAEVPAGPALGEDGKELNTEARGGSEGDDNAAAGGNACIEEKGGQLWMRYTYTQLFMDALPFVVLYDICLLLQTVALMFLNVSDMTTDLYAALTLTTGLLTRFFLSVELSANQIAGLGLIVLALALIAILQEALGVQGDDDATTASDSVSDTTLGILCALGAGACYATTNVTMQQYLRSSPIGPLTLTAAYSAIAFASATVLIYPAMWWAGLTSTPLGWWRDLYAAPMMVSAFILVKCAWYNLEAVLVKRLGAFWASVSGVALIAPAWIAELVAWYVFHDTSFGSQWQTPGSYLQLLIFASLAIGVCVYNEIIPVFARAKPEVEGSEGKGGTSAEEGPLLRTER